MTIPDYRRFVPEMGTANYFGQQTARQFVEALSEARLERYREGGADARGAVQGRDDRRPCRAGHVRAAGRRRADGSHVEAAARLLGLLSPEQLKPISHPIDSQGSAQVAERRATLRDLRHLARRGHARGSRGGPRRVARRAQRRGLREVAQRHEAQRLPRRTRGRAAHSRRVLLSVALLRRAVTGRALGLAALWPSPLPHLLRRRHADDDDAHLHGGRAALCRSGPYAGIAAVRGRGAHRTGAHPWTVGCPATQGDRLTIRSCPAACHRAATRARTA